MKNPSDNWEELRRKVLGFGDSSVHKTHYPSLRRRLVELERLRSELQRSEAYLSEAQRASRTGSFGWKVSSGELYWSDETFQIFQYARTTKPTMGLVLKRTHPEDVAFVKQTLERAAQDRKDLDFEHRLLMPDGSVKHVHAVGHPQTDKSSELVEFIGAVIDVTAEKRAEEAMRESEDKLRLLLDSTAEAIYGIDLEHRCTFCNPACLRTLGYEQVDEMLGKNMHNLIHHTRADGTLHPVEECRVRRVTRTGEGSHAEDEVLWRANGTSFPVEYWSYPQRRGNTVVGAVVALIDITERKLAEAALASVSRKLIQAQERERTRIARELHDDIGQRLALLVIKLQQLQSAADLSPELRSHADELWKETSEIASDVQSLSHELHSSKLEHLGIVAAMRGFCREFSEQQREWRLTSKPTICPAPLSADISLEFSKKPYATRRSIVG